MSTFPLETILGDGTISPILGVESVSDQMNCHLQKPLSPKWKSRLGETPNFQIARERWDSSLPEQLNRWVSQKTGEEKRTETMQFAKCTAAWGGAGSKGWLWTLTVGAAWDIELRVRCAPVLLRTQSLQQNVQKWLLDTKKCSLIGSLCFDTSHWNLPYAQQGTQQKAWVWHGKGATDAEGGDCATIVTLRGVTCTIGKD